MVHSHNVVFFQFSHTGRKPPRTVTATNKRNKKVLEDSDLYIDSTPQMCWSAPKILAALRVGQNGLLGQPTDLMPH